MVELLAMEDEVAPQIFFPHHGIGGQLFGGPLEKNLSLEEQVGTIGNTQCFGGIVVGNENADVFLL